MTTMFVSNRALLNNHNVVRNYAALTVLAFLTWIMVFTAIVPLSIN